MNRVTRRLARAAIALAVRLYRWSDGRIGDTGPDGHRCCS